MTTNQEAIRSPFCVERDSIGDLPPSVDAFTDREAPAVRNVDCVRELAMLRWGMSCPPQFGGTHVTNIRRMASPHWRRQLGVGSRCVAPWTAFCEYDQTPDPVTKRKTKVWFALSEDLPLACFAGDASPRALLGRRIRFHARVLARADRLGPVWARRRVRGNGRPRRHRTR